MNSQPNLIAILEGGPAENALAESLASEGLPIVRFSSPAELSQSDRLSSIAVLVFGVHKGRLGSLLIALSRLSVEYPGMQKLAIVEGELSVTLATYLITCSVKLLEIYLDASGSERIVRAARRILEQRTWCFTPGEELILGLQS